MTRFGSALMRTLWLTDTMMVVAPMEGGDGGGTYGRRGSHLEEGSWKASHKFKIFMRTCSGVLQELPQSLSRTEPPGT